MGDSLAAVLVLALLIVFISLGTRAYLVGDTVVRLAEKEAFDRTEKRARTDFRIEVSAPSGSSLTVTVKNEGIVSFSDFAHMDFIVKYVSTAGGGTTVITWLTYTTGVLAADEWKKTSITPDNLEPNVWNRTETMTLDALVANTLQSGTTGTLTVVTPNGVAATGFFTVP